MPIGNHLRLMKKMMRGLMECSSCCDFETADSCKHRGTELRGSRTPLIDIRDLGNKITIDIEIPGVEKKDIELRLSEKTLGISAQKKIGKEIEKDGKFLSERSFSTFRRMMPLPVEIVPEKAEARFDKGILHIEVPKARSKNTGKKIQIK